MVSAKIVAAAAVFASTVAAQTVDPIVIKGSKFFYKTNGTQFFIKGVAYQQDIGAAGTGSTTSTTINDPLTDESSCNRDIPYLLELETNTIRVYSIDPTQNHDACMSALASAGIYVLADLSAPDDSINQADPAWNEALYQRYTSVVDVMANYTNTLGFFAGNEVANNASNIDTMPFVKAAVRDTKAYIKQQNYRPLGVGYAADDDPSIRNQVEDYLNCANTEDSIDFYGYNIYSWCGESNFVESDYQARTEEFANYSIPAFFAEYGCNTPPRLFEETLSLYSSNMTGVWSGGIVFEYFQAPNDYGLVSADGNSVSKLAAFTQYSSQIHKVTPTGVNAASYTPTNTALRTCPTGFSGLASTTSLPPTPNEQLCSCMVKNLTCVAKSSVNSNAYGALFAAACNPENGAGICDGIAANGSTGSYGAYSMCDSADQLSWAFNAYFMEQAAQNSANTDACDFGGNATTQSPSLPSGCAALVSQAGPAGTGVVTSAPSGTGAVGGSSSSSVAFALQMPALDMALFKLGAYVATAALVGAGMIIL